MAKFCGTCGTPLNEGQKFCGKCGNGNSVQQSSPAQAPTSSPSPGFSQPVAVSAPVPVRSNALLKVGIAAVLIIFVGGAAALGAVYYAVHKVKEKAQAVSKQVLSDGSTSPDSGLGALLKKAAASASSDGADGADSGGFKGDPCRFLRKEDVSRAVGIQIFRTQAQDGGCSYIAQGDPADMVSKHMTSMVTSQAKSNGSSPTADQTKMMQQITGAFFKQQEASDKNLSKEAATGEVLILSVSFSTGNAELEMKMNRAAFNHITGGNGDGKTTDQKASGDLDGIGDDAYEMGGSGLIFRKGQTVVHMMFPECPCDANAIKPLAANIANQL
ncbi:MAG TPA: zinc ribbon domain-containing protein [Terracidiphilus sp.]|jgi:hypothetical protein